MTIKSILIIDDSEPEHFIYNSLIKSYDSDIEIFTAHDGQEGLEFLENNPKPDCILLDINMPRMNGFEFLDVYSEKYDNQHVIIAMLTSSLQTDDKDKAMSYEAVSSYFDKPLSHEDIQRLAEISSH